MIALVAAVAGLFVTYFAATHAARVDHAARAAAAEQHNRNLAHQILPNFDKPKMAVEFIHTLLSAIEESDFYESNIGNLLMKEARFPLPKDFIEMWKEFASFDEETNRILTDLRIHYIEVDRRLADLISNTYGAHPDYQRRHVLRERQSICDLLDRTHIAETRAIDHLRKRFEL